MKRHIGPHAAAMAALAVLGVVVGVATSTYPSAFLAAPALWATIAFGWAAACVVAIVRPSRFSVPAAGAVVAAGTFARGIAIAVEVPTVPAGETRTSFVVAAVTWITVSLLARALFVGVVVPWNATQKIEVMDG